QIIFRSDDAARCATFGDKFEADDFGVRPNQMKTHQPRKHHADKHRDKRKRIVLFADYFVVEAENVFAPEALRRSMHVNLRLQRWFHQSTLVTANSRRISNPLERVLVSKNYCSEIFCFIHLSKSSC